MDRHVKPLLAKKNLWKGIWSLNSPNKVKKLMWRDCRNFMLRKSNLVWQTIINCPLCIGAKLFQNLHCMSYGPARNLIWFGLILLHGLPCRSSYGSPCGASAR